MATVTRRAWARVQLPGFHRWPNAPEHRAYLRDRHRHLFHLEVRVDVAHDDRDVEFHDLADMMRRWWGPGAREWGSASCEAIAAQLLVHLTGLGLRVAEVTVSEDGEAGATIQPADAVVDALARESTVTGQQPW